VDESGRTYALTNATGSVYTIPNTWSFCTLDGSESTDGPAGRCLFNYYYAIVTATNAYGSTGARSNTVGS